jgi:hypothetical protein
VRDCGPEEKELAAAASCLESLMPSGGVGLAAAGSWLGSGVGLAAAGSAVEAVGGGAGAVLGGAGASDASFAGVEVAGAEGSGMVLEGEEVVSFFFFFGAGGTKGSTLPASSVSAPVLLALVS